MEDMIGRFIAQTLGLLLAALCFKYVLASFVTLSFLKSLGIVFTLALIIRVALPEAIGK